MSFQVNHTLYDRTLSNNSGGLGFGLQLDYQTASRVKPLLELNVDYFGGTKVAYITADGKMIDSKHGIISTYAGPMLEFNKQLWIATTVGSTWYHKEAHLGIRPSIGFYFSKRKTWMTKASFTNVFQRDEVSNQSFGYLSLALGLRLP